MPPMGPQMAGDNTVEAAWLLVAQALAELSRQDISSSTSPPRADLIRNCLMLLPFLDAGEPSLAARCRHGLLATLGAILSRDPSPSLLPVLEVFAESLVTSNRLASCFDMAESAAPEESRIATEAPPCLGALPIELELLCCHFISSLQDEGGFEGFLSALSWSGKVSLGTPGTSFRGALSLINRAQFFSLPAVVQAHFLLHASRCINDQDLDLHSRAFDHSMDLYVTYLPALCVFNRTGGLQIPRSCTGEERPLSCCIRDATDQKLRSQIDELLSFCKLHSGDNLHFNESDIFVCSNRLIEENQHILHENFREEATKVVKTILSDILCCANQMHDSDPEVSDKIICLAAVIKLMAYSLQQILHHLSQMRSSTDKENVDYLALRKEYDVICEKIVRLLGQHEANELHRYDPSRITWKHVHRKRASMLMLAHFASLSICCVRRRLGFMWKGCIIMMMMAMNLAIVEGEILDIFQLPFDVSTVVPYTIKGTLKVSAWRKSSETIALQYKNIHSSCRHISANVSSLAITQKSNSIVGKVNGQAFFKCHPEYSANSSKWDDLVDFVECEEGMDYSHLLERTRKFKQFKDGKWARKKQSGVATYKRVFRNCGARQGRIKWGGRGGSAPGATMLLDW